MVCSLRLWDFALSSISYLSLCIINFIYNYIYWYLPNYNLAYLILKPKQPVIGKYRWLPICTVLLTKPPIQLSQIILYTVLLTKPKQPQNLPALRVRFERLTTKQWRSLGWWCFIRNLWYLGTELANFRHHENSYRIWIALNKEWVKRTMKQMVQRQQNGRPMTQKNPKHSNPNA